MSATLAGVISARMRSGVRGALFSMLGQAYFDIAWSTIAWPSPKAAQPPGSCDGQHIHLRLWVLSVGVCHAPVLRSLIAKPAPRRRGALRY
ncbi:hypothetical protein C2E23DRAFT_461107 [Lenzites betulinus]|nr:hypothetical protein C2E23DRAFT_461107 [Lenzites betulinus]